MQDHYFENDHEIKFKVIRRLMLFFDVEPYILDNGLWKLVKLYVQQDVLWYGTYTKVIKRSKNQ